jgi:hypothetical protein
MSDAFQGDVLAEETHSGGAWSLLILPAMLGPVIALTVAQPATVRWPATLACVIGLGTLAITWSGLWCNKVVRVKTTNGEIFLGHNDPERIVRDLNMVMGC